jgi:hypothetical protein
MAAGDTQLHDVGGVPLLMEAKEGITDTRLLE